MKKIANILGYVYGYGIMICLFAGGLTFFGYLLALFIGGETAAVICAVIYKQILPKVIYASTIVVLVGIAKMYLSGEVALTIETKRNAKKQKNLDPKGRR